jgi:hypothetical protein
MHRHEELPTSAVCGLLPVISPRVYSLLQKPSPMAFLEGDETFGTDPEEARVSRLHIATVSPGLGSRVVPDMSRQLSDLDEEFTDSPPGLGPCAASGLA